MPENKPVRIILYLLAVKYETSQQVINFLLNSHVLE